MTLRFLFVQWSCSLFVKMGVTEGGVEQTGEWWESRAVFWQCSFKMCSGQLMGITCRQLDKLVGTSEEVSARDGSLQWY